MTHVVYLNFFGVPVKVSVDTPTDDRYLRFFFHRFVAECTSVELHVTLRSENPEGFLALHRSEWIRGLNPPASRRHRAT